MSRSIFVAVLVAGLLAAVPSAAQVGSGKIAFTDEPGNLLTITGDGRTPVVFRSAHGYRLSFPRWSPDGSRIAFTQYSGTPGVFRLLVADQDGTDEHVVATGNIFLGRQPWSPDGDRIAWGSSGAGDLFTASADGGDIRRLTTDGLQKQPPSWSPAGQSLVYARTPADSSRWDLFVVGDDGSGPRQITSGGEGDVRNVHPSWSPSGGSIAFLRQINSTSAIYVVRPDGTELHRVIGLSSVYVGWPYTSAPVWSPDGAKIAYANSVNSGYSRYGRHGQEIFVVNADGSGERRLTELAPRLRVDSTPVWAPDGEQILFTRGPSSLMTMNPDGTCEGALPATRAVDTPSWQPLPGGPAIGSKTCRAVSVIANGTAFRDQSSIAIVGSVRNEGTEALTDILVKFTAPRHDLGVTPYGHPGCSTIPAGILCRLDRLERGRTRAVAALGTARRVGRDQRSRDVALRARIEVIASGPLLTTERETDEVRFLPGRCTSRNKGRGRIDGTRFPDRICGRKGTDDIHPLAGKDFVDAGAGPDRIFSKDQNADVINCGPGSDRVVADAKDKVSRDCERVRRR
jgi:Tol biopolymer transport system component